MNILRFWSEIEPLFDQAVQLDEQQRTRWLAQLDVTQPDVAQAIRQLISRREALNADGFLRGNVFEKLSSLAPSLHELLAEQVAKDSTRSDQLPHAPALSAGAIIGRYRLIREIGHGGMSSVWLAEHSDGELKRQVALKLPFLWQRMQLERFLRERDLLAALTHPRIARLYDAGFSESGQPYLAMEHIAGTTLLDNCDQRQLTIQQRLQLFLQVLEAVQFAHARLIIHRDLKPSNILVTAEGNVTLLDFGIGKLLSGDATKEAVLTQLPGQALTPEYASPEQIAGQSLGIASDIYSLGVVLFELLTGKRPYRLGRHSRAALEEAILNEFVHWPSRGEISDAAATARGSSARVLKSLLTGDLDAIVIKALKKNPADRYASVTAFAQDIANHLNHLPVSAQPDSYRYRANKFLTRHRVPVAAATFALCALIVGTGVALWQARVAATQSDRAIASAAQNEAISHFFDTILTDAAYADKPVTVRELMARGTRLALQNTRGNPESRAAVLGMIASEYVTLFELKQAKQLADAAVDLLSQSRDRALKSKLRCKRAYIGASLGDPVSAVTQIKAELSSLQDDARTASSCLDDLAYVCGDSPHACARGDSLRYAEQALALLRTLPNPTDITIGKEAALLDSVAYGHHQEGRNREADRFFAQALLTYELIGVDNNNALSVQSNWAVVAEVEGRPKYSLQIYEDILRLQTQRDPDSGPSPIVLYNKARALTAIGRFTEARGVFESLCRLAETHDDPFPRFRCAIGSAALDLQTGALQSARAFIERAERLVAADYAPNDPLVFVVAVARGQYAITQGDFTTARAKFDRTIAQGHDTAPVPYVMALLGLAEVELGLGNHRQAWHAALRALDATRSQLGEYPYSHRVGQANILLGRALQQLSRHTEARAAFQQAVTHLSNTVDENHPALVQARKQLTTT